MYIQQGREAWAFGGHTPSSAAEKWLINHVACSPDYEETNVGRLAWSKEPTDILQATASKGFKDSALDYFDVFESLGVYADPSQNEHDMTIKEHHKEAIFVVSGIVAVHFMESDQEPGQTALILPGQGLAFNVLDTDVISVEADTGNSHALYVAGVA